MSIMTTFNLKSSTKAKIDDISEKSQTSRSDIVIFLLHKIIHSKQNYCQKTKAVRYQRRLKNKWCKFHIRLQENDYEICLDLRKFCKKSISLLISEAFDLYFDELYNLFCNNLKIKHTVDNYPFINYFIIYEEIESAVCWKIYWGVPEITP